MDFRNEALNMLAMKSKLQAFRHSDTLDSLIIPDPLMHLTSRRVLTMEWVTGVKLTQLPGQQIRDIVKVGQEAFLVQLLEIGAPPAQRWRPTPCHKGNRRCVTCI
jgi:aarF domain-containing kinase